MLRIRVCPFARAAISPATSPLRVGLELEPPPEVERDAHGAVSFKESVSRPETSGDLALRIRVPHTKSDDQTR